jgi:predicted enzyme related to lactoylglutathione lyase
MTTSPFVWHELLTTDPPAALAFYTALFGWASQDGALVAGGRKVAGVRASKIPPHWAPFVHVADPEAAAVRGVAGGGRIAGRPTAPPGVVLVDPRGVPTVLCAQPGDDVFTWHILESTDVAGSAAWLETIAGFGAPPGRGLWRGAEQVGSLAAAAHDRWLGLVLVPERRAVRERALSLGGRLEQGDVEAAGNGSYDVLLDPQGAAFCAFQGT